MKREEGVLKEVTGANEVAWKKAIQSVLNGVGLTTHYSSANDTYDELVKIHKEIYKGSHDPMWVQGPSRQILDTYLLVKIHGMLKYQIDKEMGKSHKKKK